MWILLRWHYKYHLSHIINHKLPMPKITLHSLQQHYSLSYISGLAFYSHVKKLVAQPATFYWRACPKQGKRTFIYMCVGGIHFFLCFFDFSIRFWNCGIYLIFFHFFILLNGYIICYHIFVRYPYRFVFVINEDVPDPYQCPGQITGYCALHHTTNW